MPGFTIVVAHDENLGIGQGGKLPWDLPEDLRHFKITTTRKDLPTQTPVILMGLRTWESLPRKPLPGRHNAVLSRTCKYIKGAELLQNLDSAVISFCSKEELGHLFVIGGSQVYAEAIKHPLLSELVVTEVEGTFDCDCFFPEYRTDVSFQLVDEAGWLTSSTGVRYKHKIYRKAHHA